MRKIIIASQNPAKVNAVRSAFSTLFPDQEWEFIGVSVPSEVADQPMSDEETKQGALNRVRNAKQRHPGAEYYVGLEAGIEENKTFAWMIVELDQQRGESRSACLMLPPLVLERLRQAKELGDVMDEVFGTENIKQMAEPLAFNPPPSHPQHSLSSGLNSRSDPFINPEHYPSA